jgi:hypothetical protein
MFSVERLSSSPTRTAVIFVLNKTTQECYASVMSSEQIVDLLVAERNRLDAAIDALQSSVKGDGRPLRMKRPASHVAAPAPVASKRAMSAAGRKAIADAARKRWAAVKAAKAPAPPPVAQRRALNATARKAMADAAKKRWAAIKAGKAPNPFAKAKSKTAKKS